MECPAPEAIQGLLDGTVEAAERAALEEHVDGCAECRRVVAALAPGSIDTMHDKPRARDEAAPSQLGRYQLEGVLGTGGMGVVYAAHDPELHRPVAVKLLRDTGLVAGTRLQREAQAMARIAHPNVITVHDVGVWRDQVFVAMELAPDGRTLRRWQRGRPWREVLDVYLQAGRGLAAAHAAGVVHRDFKPDNVLIGADGRPRVTDFGLARAPDAAARPRSSPSPLATPLTITGTVMGTPAYMAPEQHRGETADARSDQFAFCVALWEAVCGARPFAGDSGEALLAAIVRGALAPAPPGVPPALLRVLRRGLAEEPARRWPDMGALLDALAAVPRRARRRVLAAVAGAALVVALAVLVLAGRGEPEAEPDPVETAIRADLARALELAIRGEPGRGGELATEALGRARGLAAPGLLAEALIARGQLHALAGDLPRAEAMFVEAVQRAEAARADAVKTDALGKLVEVLDAQGKSDDARRWRGMLPASTRPEATADVRASALEAEARSLLREGKHADALTRIEQARALRHGGEPRAFATNRMLAHEIQLAAGNRAAARATMTELADAALPADIRAGAYLTLATLALGEGELEAGEEMARRSLDQLAAAKIDGLATAPAWTAIGTARVQRGDAAEGARAFEAAIAAYGSDRLGIAKVHSSWAFAASQRGDVETALREAAAALALHREAGGDGDTTAFYQLVLGELLADAGRLAHARAPLEAALAALEPTAKPDDLWVARSRLALARVLVADEPARARQLAEQARAVFVVRGAPMRGYLAKAEAWLAAHPPGGR